MKEIILRIVEYGLGIPLGLLVLAFLAAAVWIKLHPGQNPFL